MELLTAEVTLFQSLVRRFIGPLSQQDKALQKNQAFGSGIMDWADLIQTGRWRSRLYEAAQSFARCQEQIMEVLRSWASAHLYKTIYLDILRHKGVTK